MTYVCWYLCSFSVKNSNVGQSLVTGKRARRENLGKVTKFHSLTLSFEFEFEFETSWAGCACVSVYRARRSTRKTRIECGNREKKKISQFIEPANEDETYDEATIAGESKGAASQLSMFPSERGIVKCVSYAELECVRVCDLKNKIRDFPFYCYLT